MKWYDFLGYCEDELAEITRINMFIKYDFEMRWYRYFIDFKYMWE